MRDITSGFTAGPLANRLMRTFSVPVVLTRKIQTLSYRLAIVAYLSIIIAGNVPGARADIGEYAPGGVLHSIAYATITLLLFAGSEGTRDQRSIKAILTVMLMGAGDEFIQSFFPYRGADVRDWLVDVLAAVTCSAALWAAWPKIVAGNESSYQSPR